MIEDVVRPSGPYRLHLMTYRRPAFETPLPGGRRGQAWQRSDGLVVLRAPDEESLTLLRFMLALDSDTTEFTQRFRHDPLLGPSIRHLHGLRPLRRATVAHSVLRAVCGQLIEARRGAGDRAGDRAGVRRARAEPAGDRHPLTGGAAPARPRDAARVGARPHLSHAGPRGATRTADRSGGGPAPARARPRPWSLGVIALEGLGSYRHGLVGDLALVKLCSSLRGRWVELHETAELLAPYEEWAGLAGVYLMKGWGAGLVPGASADRARLVRCRAA